MATGPETLATYVPAGLIRALAGGRPDQPLARTLDGHGALLFADLSGFTPLAEAYAQRGPEGVEELSRLLATFLGALVDAVLNAGGEVVSFAGDSIVAVWLDAAEPVPLAVRRAATAAVHARAAVAGLTGAHGERLTLRIGVGAGELTVAAFGSRGRRAIGVYGAAADSMIGAQAIAGGGEIVLSPSAAAAAGSAVTGAVGVDGHLRLDRVAEPTGPTRPARAPDAAPWAHAYHPFAPLAAVRHAEDGLARLPPEFRRVSAVFVSVPGLDFRRPDLVDRADEALEVTLQALAVHDGALHQLVLDDKGVVLVAMFGHPYRSQEAIETRAALAGADVAAGLARIGLPGGVGVATGLAFCGAIGTAVRREYTTIGTVMNRAARIMAASPGRVRVDAATADAARDRVRFRPAGTEALKGLGAPIALYTPEGAREAARAATPLVGREAEQALFEAFAADLAQGRPRAALVEGPAGIGKSVMARAVLDTCAATGIATLAGYSDMARRDAPYRPWRAIVAGLFASPSGAPDPAEVLARLAQLRLDQEGLPTPVELAPLLTAFGVPGGDENSTTSAMTGVVRARNTHHLVCALLAASAAARPTLVYLDDLHWADEASLALLAEVAARVPALGLLTTARPFTGDPPEAVARFLATPGLSRVVLAELDRRATRDLAAAAVGADELPTHVATWLHTRSGGNPFFARELASSLVQLGAIHVEEGRCTGPASAEALNEIPIPHTVEGVVGSRIDRLGLAGQTALKAASVVGKDFSEETVVAVLGDPSAQGALLEALRAGMIVPAEGGEGRLSFAHDITLKVAYGRIVGEDRRRMHAAAAAWYEQAPAELRAIVAPTLANHYARAGMPDRELACLDESAAHAARTGAYEEARRFLARAMELEATVDAGDDDATRLRRARRRRQLADCEYAKGNRAAARSRALETVAAADRPFPTSPAGLALLAWAYLAFHLAAAVVGDRIRARSAERRGLHEEASAAAQIVTYVSYLEGHKLPWAASCVYAAAQALRAGPTAVTARGYVTMAGVCGVLQLDRIANHYYRLAREAAALADNAAALHFVDQIEVLVANGNGNWRLADQKAAECVRFYRNLGDLNELAVSLVLWIGSARIAGDHPSAAERGRRLLLIARESGNVLHAAWAHKVLGECAIVRGDDAEAVDQLERTLASMEQNQRQSGGVRSDAPTEAATRAMLGLPLWRLGQRVLARQRQDEGVEWLRRFPLENYHQIDGYWCSAVTYAMIHEAGDPSGARGLDEVIRLMAPFAMVTGMARPRLALMRGMRAALAGDTRRARAYMEKARAGAEALSLTYDLGLAELYRGRLDQDDARLARACEHFEATGAEWWLVEASATRSRAVATA